MTELKRTELSVHRERAILVAVLVKSADLLEDEDPLEELQGLVTTAGANVVGTLTQRRLQPDKKTYLGQGKVEELTSLISLTKAAVVIFDNDLSPAQIRNLEQLLDTKVLDRSELILDIFATRAQTYESRLQVELAQLQYALPRLKRMWTHLSRIEGGIGTRGPGEKQLEEDRRQVEGRITDLRRRLRDVEVRKQRQVESRNNIPTISLVGYTNAGKSTLMNALTDAGVLTENRLFATLETRTRRWQLPDIGFVLLSDTVGFIRNLPHHLIASFKATLEEANQADLLLHVVDASSPSAKRQVAIVEKVLKELNTDQKRTLLVLNKVDMINDISHLHVLRYRYPRSISVSARTGQGLDQLAQAVADTISEHYLDLEIELDVGNGRLLSMVEKHGQVFSRRYVNGRAFLHCRIPPSCLPHFQRDDVRIHNKQVKPRLDNTAR
mgnify:FL=1